MNYIRISICLPFFLFCILQLLPSTWSFCPFPEFGQRIHGHHVTQLHLWDKLDHVMDRMILQTLFSADDDEDDDAVALPLGAGGAP